MTKPFAIACLLLASCGGARPEAWAPTSSPSAEDTPDGPNPWDGLTAEQKKVWMRTVVVPRMSEVLRDFDATRFARVGCVTCHSDLRGCKRSGQTSYVQVECSSCHGQDGLPGNFKMPNPWLPRLSPSLGADNAKAAMFMKAVVVPEMRRLVRTKPFGCDKCHKPAD